MKDGQCIDSNNYDIICYSGEKLSSTGTSVQLNVGYNMLLAIGKNDYYGCAKHQINSYIDLSDSNIMLQDTYGQQYDDGQLSIEFTGKPIKPAVSLSIGNELIMQNIPAWSFSYQPKYGSLIHDSFNSYESYVCNYINNTSVSQNGASVIIKPTYISSSLSGKTLVFYITPTDISNCFIYGFKDVIEYDPQTSSMQNDMSLIYGETHKLSENKDYSLRYLFNDSLGDTIIYISGINDFYKEIRKDYKISGNISDESTKIYSDPQFSSLIENVTYAYTGEPISISAYVKLKDKLELPLNEYSIKYNDDKTTVGLHSARICGENNCSGSFKDFSYVISTDLSNCSFYPDSKDMIYQYTGKKIFPDIQISYGSMTLIKDVDYECIFQDDCINIGIHKFNIVGKTYWLGSKDYNFYIISESNTLLYKKDSLLVLDENIKTLDRRTLNLSVPSDDNLVKIVVGSHVISCEENLLSNCTSLVEADFSKCTDPSFEIPAGCFKYCNSLTSISMPGIMQ